MIRFSIIVFVIVLSNNLFSQSSKDTTNSGFKPNLTPSLDISKVANDKIVIDGMLNEDAWKDATIADNWTEVNPGDNVKPAVETKCYTLYDDDNIYFAFECFDDMKTLRVSMCDRDRMYQDDFIGSMVDTYNDQKQSYEFYSNAYGIQGDLILTPENETTSPDFVFYTEAKIYKDKWTVEFQIPFKSIRFPDKKEQVWRIHFFRTRQRGIRQEIFWASVSRDNPNFLGQMGILKGMKNVHSGKNFEILPSILGTLDANIDDPEDVNSKLKYGKIEPEIGLNLKYGITSTLTTDLTINPDFSQIEADAQQITQNNISALFLQEKRPYFLEGNDIFQMPVYVYYSRTINHPFVSAKLTGRIKKFSIGLMTAYDDNTPFLIPYEQGSTWLTSSKKSLASILRMKYDLGGENYIGAVFSDREFSKDTTRTFKFDGYNRVFGVDGRFSLLSNYYISAMLLGYSTKELNDPDFYTDDTKFGKDNKYDLTFNGEQFNGFGSYLSFQRSARSWNFNINYNYQTPTARRDIGYSGRNDFGELSIYQEYVFYSEGKIFQKIIPFFNGGIRHTAEWKLRDRYIYAGVNFRFRNGIFFSLGFLPLNDEMYYGLDHKNVHRGNFNVNWNVNKYFYFEGYGETGKFIVRFENPSYVGWGNNFGFYLELKPLDRLNIRTGYDYSDLAKTKGGEMLYAGYVINSSLNFQFNKWFSMRAVIQYDEFSDAIHFDPLISYKWNPFTVFYLGSTHTFNYYDYADAPSKRKESERQFFVKFQYLWRM
jgi:hypothetical protein